MSAQGLPVTNATALAMSTSQNHPNASFDVSSDVTRHSSLASGTLQLVDILLSDKSVVRLSAFADPLLAYQPQFSSSPMDSLLRRPDQGLTLTEIDGTSS
jgi:hypothetical protein